MVGEGLIYGPGEIEYTNGAVCIMSTRAERMRHYWRTLLTLSLYTIVVIRPFK